MVDTVELTRAEAERPIIKCLRAFVRLQGALIDALGAQFGASPSRENLLFEMPRRGELQLGDCIWTFARHGAGVRFVEAGSRRVVDVTDMIEDTTLFDAWRVATYLGSLRRTGAKLVQRELGCVQSTRLDEASRRVVSRLVGESVLELHGRHVRFVTTLA